MIVIQAGTDEDSEGALCSEYSLVLCSTPVCFHFSFFLFSLPFYLPWLRTFRTEPTIHLRGFVFSTLLSFILWLFFHISHDSQMCREQPHGVPWTLMAAVPSVCAATNQHNRLKQRVATLFWWHRWVLMQDDIFTNWSSRWRGKIQRLIL